MTPPISEDGSFVAGDIRVQTALVLDNIKLLLESAGSSLDKVVKCTLFCTNAAYWGSINEVYATYFPKNPPTRTFCTVGSWPQEFDVEAEVIALA